MDAFVFIIVGGMGAMIIGLVLIGKYYPGSGADVLDWKPTRSIETEVELEADDVQQMLDAQNERRRRRGLSERTLEEIEEEVAAGLREQRRQHEASLTRQAGADEHTGAERADAGGRQGNTQAAR